MQGSGGDNNLAQSMQASQSSSMNNNDLSKSGKVAAEPVVPANLFHKLQKAILAVQDEKQDSQVKALCSLVDKMTPRLFMKAC